MFKFRCIWSICHGLLLGLNPGLRCRENMILYLDNFMGGPVKKKHPVSSRHLPVIQTTISSILMAPPSLLWWQCSSQPTASSQPRPGASLRPVCSFPGTTFSSFPGTTFCSFPGTTSCSQQLLIGRQQICILQLWRDDDECECNCSWRQQQRRPSVWRSSQTKLASLKLCFVAHFVWSTYRQLEDQQKWESSPSSTVPWPRTLSPVSFLPPGSPFRSLLLCYHMPGEWYWQRSEIEDDTLIKNQYRMSNRILTSMRSFCQFWHPFRKVQKKV